jgi:hypothetical protein
MGKQASALLLGVLFASGVAACGGGGGGGASTTPGALATGPASVATANPTSSALPAGEARASFSITIPASTGSASVRRAKAIGAGTQSITFTLLEAAGSTPATTAPQTFTLTSANPNCSTSPTTGSLTCTLSVDAPIGLDVFLAQTYTGTSGNGTLTGSGAVQLDVAANSSNTATLSLTSQAASVFLTSSSSYLGYNPDPYAPAGSPVTSMRVFVIALDSSGNAILNPSIYSQPISLELFYEGINTEGYYEPLASTSSPDVLLQVAYSSSVDPGGCGYNASTSASYGSVQICSPADIVTATIQNVTGGPQSAAILGSVGATGYFPSPPAGVTPTPLPSSTPAGTSYIVIPVTVTPASTSTPTPGGNGNVTVVGQ